MHPLTLLLLLLLLPGVQGVVFVKIVEAAVKELDMAVHILRHLLEHGFGHLIFGVFGENGVTAFGAFSGGQRLF